MDVVRLFAARRAARTLLLTAAASALLGGCVAQKEYDDTRGALVSTTDLLAQTRQERDDLRQEVELLQRQRAADEAAVNDLRSANAQLRQQLDGANATMRGLDERIQGLALLDPETDRALSELAQRYPQLISYDASRGMLRFAADLTFDSGSAVVKDSAKASLAALGDILKTGPAEQYEVHVVGHTDAQPISSGTAQRHPTNMHLSCHRAIAVRSELVALGVPPQKMQAAGWGEHRPTVPNRPGGNTPQNRRVEIFLTAPTGDMSAALPTPDTNVAPVPGAVPARQPDPTK